MTRAIVMRQVRDANQEPIKRSHKKRTDLPPKPADGVTWPAHVLVQRIPGMERTQGVPGNLYVDPASVPRVDVREWGKA